MAAAAVRDDSKAAAAAAPSVWFGAPVVLRGHGGPVYAVAVSPNSQLIASASNDCTVMVWDRSGCAISTMRHDDVVRGLDWSPCGELLLSGSLDCTVRIWQAHTGKELRKLTFDHVVWRVRWQPSIASRNSSCFAVAVSDTPSSGEVLLVDANSTKQDGKAKVLRRFDIGGSRAYGLRFSRDGSLLAVGLRNPSTRVFESASGRQLLRMEGHSDPVSDVCFSPTGRMVATCSYDSTIKTWSLSDGALLHTLPGHTNSVFAVSFSADGALLASASNDSTLRVWHAASGRQLQELHGHSAVGCCDFASDGTYLASCNFDSTVWLWSELVRPAVPVNAWQRAAATLAFLRANRTHPFRHSVLALLPQLCALALPAYTQEEAAAVAAAVRVREFNADKFLDSRFAREQLHQTPAAAVPAESCCSVQ